MIQELEDAASKVYYIAQRPTPDYYGGTSYKGSSVKHGSNPKAIKARRKKNKNKKTHRR